MSIRVLCQMYAAFWRCGGLVHPPENQHRSSSCPHLSVLNGLQSMCHVCKMLCLLEHLRSQPGLCVHEDTVSYFRPVVVHVYVVITTRRQACKPPSKFQTIYRRCSPPESVSSDKTHQMRLYAHQLFVSNFILHIYVHTQVHWFKNL